MRGGVAPIGYGDLVFPPRHAGRAEAFEVEFGGCSDVATVRGREADIGLAGVPHERAPLGLGFVFGHDRTATSLPAGAKPLRMARMTATSALSRSSCRGGCVSSLEWP